MITDTLADMLETIHAPIFVDSLPDTDNSTDVALFSTGGLEPQTPYAEIVTVQARARSVNTIDAYEVIELIRMALHEKTSFELPDGTYVVSCMALQPKPTNIGKDERDRAEFTINFALKIKNN